MYAFEEVVARLDGKGLLDWRRGDRAMSRCPAHDDRTPSLSIRQGHKGVCLHCFAGCDGKVVAERLDLLPRQLFDDEWEGKPMRRDRREVARYRYTDELDRLLYATVRYEPKDFSQVVPVRNEKGQHTGWKYGLPPEVRRVLYRLPKLCDANKDRPVWVVEGERKVEALESLDLLATTNVCGANAPWLESYSEFLAGRRVILMPDNNEPGRRHMEKVLGSLLHHGVRSAVWLELPGLPPGGDVVDWLAGNEFEELSDSRDALIRLAVSATRYGKAEAF